MGMTPWELQWMLKTLSSPINDLCFPYEICSFLLHISASKPKTWFPITGVASPCPNFSTDNRFSNPLQSMKGSSIQCPLYLSTNLYRVDLRHKCPQYCLTQQGYLPTQVPKRWVSPESTQSGLSLLFQVGMETAVSQGGWLINLFLLIESLNQIEWVHCANTYQQR